MQLARLTCQEGSQVRRRIIEYLGGEGDEPGSATCAYITRCDHGEPYAPRHLYPPEDLDRFIDRRHDLARSLADHCSLLLHLDIEHVDFDDPMAVFRDPRRAFEVQKPVAAAILAVLATFGIRPLQLLTGQGHHFVWRVAKDGSAARHFRHLAARSEAMADSEPAWSATGDAAFFGVGLVMEWLAHRVIAIAGPETGIPVSLTAVLPGFNRAGRREAVSIDLSEYGDSLLTRMIRVPFTPYRKPARWNRQNEVPWFDSLPANGQAVEELLALRGNPGAVAELSCICRTVIPHAESGTEELIDAYLRSDLRRFHRFYYSATPDPPGIWDRTYRRTPLCTLPPCARVLAEHPNEALLKPAGMQHLTRCLMTQGWHPRHAGGLIGSIFADPRHGWGGRWEHYDPARRADFYARIFSGLLATGRDGLVDFNCVSSQEKRLCLDREGCAGLETWRAELTKTLPGRPNDKIGPDFRGNPRGRDDPNGFEINE